jgi:hypothetical protein
MKPNLIFHVPGCSSLRKKTENWKGSVRVEVAFSFISCSVLSSTLAPQLQKSEGEIHRLRVFVRSIVGSLPSPLNTLIGCLLIKRPIKVVSGLSEG